MGDEPVPPVPPEDEETYDTPTDASGRPRRVAHYRVLRKVGEGGMGEVFEAEQRTPVRRRVALKLIKPGMDSRQVVARFETERQALAMMNHPSIARVFDAGSTELGRPYFAMEYVRGVPITDYCDGQRLETEARLRLFIQVCEGVQHAHQKGIIHRDIKPSNVLVELQDDQGVPKIIDFGVAKATEQNLTEKTLYTAVGAFVGTPEYMSPEQSEVGGLDVDTRTDVYSLGVLLYEILTGQLPFDNRTEFREYRRRILEEEPPTPSTRLLSLGNVSEITARKRRTDVPTLARQLKGDLDWITMKALEKDRTRRYASASELATDIRRHLNDEPVLASPPSRAYRMGKFVRRHRAGVAFASVLLVLLTGFAVAMTLQARRIALERDRAEQAREQATREATAAREVSEFLEGLFAVSDPSEARGNTITAREILDRGADKIERDLRNQPGVQARLMGTMGKVFVSLGLYGRARPLLEESLRIRRAVFGPEHPEVARSLFNLGRLSQTEGEYDAARESLELALSIDEKALGPDHPDLALSVNGLADLRHAAGDYEGARPLLERALAIREKALGPDHPDVAASLDSLGFLNMAAGDPSAARPLLERALAIREKALGPDHPAVGSSLVSLASLSFRRGDYVQARPLFERGLAIEEKTFGPDHPNLVATLTNLAVLHETTGDYERARSLYERSVSIQERALGPDHPNLANVLNNYAYLLMRMDEDAEAQSMLERAIAIDRESLGPDHPNHAVHLHSLGELLLKTRDLGGAEARLEQARSIYEKSLPPDDPYVALIHYNLACVFALRGDRAAALGALRESLERGHDLHDIATQPDLESLRGDPAFASLIEEIERRSEPG